MDSLSTLGTSPSHRKKRKNEKEKKTRRGLFLFISNAPTHWKPPSPRHHPRVSLHSPNPGHRESHHTRLNHSLSHCSSSSQQRQTTVPSAINHHITIFSLKPRRWDYNPFTSPSNIFTLSTEHRSSPLRNPWSKPRSVKNMLQNSSRHWRLQRIYDPGLKFESSIANMPWRIHAITNSRQTQVGAIFHKAKAYRSGVPVRWLIRDEQGRCIFYEGDGFCRNAGLYVKIDGWICRRKVLCWWCLTCVILQEQLCIYGRTKWKDLWAFRMTNSSTLVQKIIMTFILVTRVLLHLLVKRELQGYELDSRFESDQFLSWHCRRPFSNLRHNNAIVVSVGNPFKFKVQDLIWFCMVPIWYCIVYCRYPVALCKRITSVFILGIYFVEMQCC